jgi:hypothetical protein
VFNPLFLFYIKYLLFKIVSPNVRSECCRLAPTLLCLSIRVSQVVLRANGRQASHLQTCTNFSYQSRGIGNLSSLPQTNLISVTEKVHLPENLVPLTEKAHLQERDPQFAFLTLVLLQRSIEYVDLHTVIVFKPLSGRSLQTNDRLQDYIFS